MKTRTLLFLAALVALAAAPAARAQSISLEAFGGYQNLRTVSVDAAQNAVKHSEGTGTVGGQLLAGLGPLGVGALVDKTVSGTPQPWSGSVLAGFLLPLSVVRIELLGELGRRAIDFGDVFSSKGATFVGFRPGVSFRLAPTNFIIGVSGIARWPTSNGDIGDGTYGAVARVGIGIF